MLSVTFLVTCTVCTKKKLKWPHDLYRTQNVCYVVYCYIFDDKKMLILNLVFLLIIGSLGSLYETAILFHWKQQFLNIISIFKPLDLYFPILKQVLKSELLNYLKNSRNSLICFIAMSMCVLSKEFQTHFIVCVWQGGDVSPHIETILGHQLGVPQFNSILTLLACTQNQIPRWRAQSYKTNLSLQFLRHTHTHQMPVASWSCPLCFWLTGYRGSNSLLGFNFLAQLRQIF